MVRPHVNDMRADVQRLGLASRTSACTSYQGQPPIGRHGAVSVAAETMPLVHLHGQGGASLPLPPTFLFAAELGAEISQARTAPCDLRKA